MKRKTEPSANSLAINERLIFSLKREQSVGGAVTVVYGFFVSDKFHVCCEHFHFLNGFFLKLFVIESKQN